MKLGGRYNLHVIGTLLLSVLATSTAGDTTALNAEAVLARVRSAYSVDAYHGQAVVQRSFNDFQETSETFYTRRLGIKHTARTAANATFRTPVKTLVYYGPPSCVRVHWIERDEVTACRDLCGLGDEALPLRIVCQFVLGHPSTLPEGVTPSPRVEWRRLHGKPVYVVRDLTDYGDDSELWIDPASFKILRFVRLRGTAATSVEFKTVSLGRKVTEQERAYEPRFSINRFRRNHQSVFFLTLLVLLLMLATGGWYAAYWSAGETWELRAASRRRRWRVWMWISATGYVCVVVLGLVLLRAEGGHPPAVVIAFIAGYMWTLVVVFSSAILAAAHLAELVYRRCSARS